MMTEAILRGKTIEEMHQEIALAYQALEIALDYFCQYNQLPPSNQWGSVDFWINKAQERLGLKLLPCPFCGRKPYLKQINYSKGLAWSARCDSKCNGQTNHVVCIDRATRDEAIAAWNKRA